MANRSYLYSADSLPTSVDQPSPVRCISEHNGSIPLAHLILVGRNTAIVPSMLWDATIGLTGDFAGGEALLADLLRVVGEGNVPHRERFDECVRRTFSHLGDQRSKYLLLETGEVLGDGEPEAEVRYLLGHDIPEAVSRAEAAIAGAEQNWLASIRSAWPEHFESFYSDWLYFSFPEE